MQNALPQNRVASVLGDCAPCTPPMATCCKALLPGKSELCTTLLRTGAVRSKLRSPKSCAAFRSQAHASLRTMFSCETRRQARPFVREQLPRHASRSAVQTHRKSYTCMRPMLADMLTGSALLLPTCLHSTVLSTGALP